MAHALSAPGRATALPARLYDAIREQWDRKGTSRATALVLLVFFLLSAMLILANRAGFLPGHLGRALPTDPFAAVHLAFSLVLAVEVIELVFAVSDSVAAAVGKQLEIMALLLLRDSFTDISQLSSHCELARDWFALTQVAVTALGGLALFMIRVLFARYQYVHSYRDMQGYVNVKKTISLLLLLVFIGAALRGGYTLAVHGGESGFFETFYTALIFADILLVLVGQYFAPSFQATFRNSGFAVSTLLMRLAMGAPHYLGALLCVFAGLYLLALSWALARSMTPGSARQGPPDHARQNRRRKRRPAPRPAPDTGN